MANLNPRDFNVIGRGAYSPRDAERLTGVPVHRIQRWAKGYTYKYRGEKRYSPPLIAESFARDDDELTLDFADMLEIRFLNVFRERGLSWKVIRLAALRAKELLGRHHPFSSRIFMTDGQTIMTEIVHETGDKNLLDIVKNQYVFKSVVAPSLYAGFEFNSLSEPTRWWPLGENRRVVIDPARAFGAPIASKSGVPTQVLSNAYNVEQSYAFVARWYEVEVKEVKDAVKYEARLAA